MQQLTIDAWLQDRKLEKKPPCPHDHRCVTRAYVPAGIACLDCGTLIAQYIPQPPEIWGYLSADWAWKYKDGNEWTTQWPGEIPKEKYPYWWS